MREIERFHEIAPATCYRCARTARCERAHVIDRVAFPAETSACTRDHVSIIVPLCYACHRAQPSFGRFSAGLAWAWMRMDAWQAAEWIVGSLRDSMHEYACRAEERLALVECDYALSFALTPGTSAQQIAILHLAPRLAETWAAEIADPSIGLTTDALVKRALRTRAETGP